MPRNHRGFLIATSIIAALLTATSACAAAGAAPAGSGKASVRAVRAGGPAAAAPGKPVDVLSASFVSPSTGWVLAERPCESPAKSCRPALLLRGTVNGGRTWFAVPAPPAPPADMFQSSPPRGGVGRILFTSARDGWAAGPSLWRTTDGGATWRRVPVPGPVAGFTVAGGRMFAVIGGCTSAGHCAFRGYAAAAGAGNWRPVPGTAHNGNRRFGGPARGFRFGRLPARDPPRSGQARAARWLGDGLGALARAA